MAQTCKQIDEWIEEEVSRPVERWEDRQERKCRSLPWWNPLGWLCWIVVLAVKVVRWVLVTVGRWVARTVCELVATVIDIVVDVVIGLVDVIVGIFTFDPRRIVDGLIRIGGGIVHGFIKLVRIVFLIDTIDFVRTEIEEAALKRHVRGLLEAKYSGAALDQIKAAIRLDDGAFGLRLKAHAFRTVLDSTEPSPTDRSAPNLVVLHESGAIDLRELCGFEFNEGFWNRKRYKTLKRETVLAGGGGGEFDNPIDRDELNEYLTSRGASGPAFTVLPMRDGVLDTKLTTAEEKGRELGLMITWDKDTVPVTRADHINHNGFDTRIAGSSLVGFLTEKIGRKDKTVDDPGAIADLCTPVAVGVFRYTDALRGLASNLRTSACGLDGRNASGVTFIDNIPDRVWKYVVVHELGHYFGLCHVDGLDRIMLSTRENSWFSWSTFPNLLLVKGEPCFTHGEAKQVWDYIVEHFAPECLGVRR